MQAQDGDALRAGERLGGYVVEGELARGGMGTVYRARDPVLARAVALKVIAPAHGRDPAFRERFRSECLLAARIEHPAVIPIYRSGQDRGRLFLAMRLIAGTDLATLLRSGPLAPERAVAILTLVAGALDAAHAAGLVHRDVKPGNVLLDGEHAYLTDFGIALAGGGDARQTGTGRWLGTPAYAAPEQIRGGDVDGRTDVYALGGLLHHCLTGELPFPGAGEIAAISAHLTEPPPRPSRIAPGVPAGFDDVVARAMSKDPADRFPTAGALAAAAAAALAGARHRLPGEPIPWVGRDGLPDQPSALVGRHRELAELLELLSHRRLVTLTGPGGAGKTRLALQVAADAADRFADGVVFAPLAAVADPAHVAPTIAQRFDMPEGGPADREALLVIDNAEQVVAGAAAAVADLLATAPRLRLLVTSRVRLDLHEEQEYPVQPLAPGDATELFVQAARRARPAFAPDRHVDELVRRLDGLPLALELAASRVRVLTVEQIAERLGRGLDLLSTRARDVPVRQRTLRATIEWSHALLGPDERERLARAAVLAGSFDPDTAAAVCDADVDDLEALVDHSLLRETGDGRFFLLDTIRAFAAEQLAARPDLDADTRARHLRHFAAFVEGGAPSGPDAPAWLARLRRELPNLRVALQTAAATDPDALARMVADLSWGWRWLGHLTEYGEWLERARALHPADPAVRVRLLDAAGMVAHDGDRYAEAAAHFEAAAALARELGDRRAELTARTRAAIQHVQLGDLAAGEARLREALAGAEELGDRRVGARIVNNLAGIALIRGDYAAGLHYAEDAAATYEALGDEHLSAQALNNAAIAAVHLDLHERAGRHFEQALAVFARLELGEYIVYALIGVAAAAARTGDARTAALLLGRAEALRAELEFHLQPFERGVADAARAAACAALGEPAAARLLAEGAELTDAQALELATRPWEGPATVRQ